MQFAYFIFIYNELLCIIIILKLEGVNIKFKAIINGEYVNSENYIEIISPWNLKKIGEVSSLNKNDIDKAFLSASIAKTSWSKKTLLERINTLKKWLNIIIEHKIDIAKIMVEEIAKNYEDSINEIERTISYFKYTLEDAKQIQPQAFDANFWGNPNKLAIFEYVPKGIILAISPFNYPVNLSLAKIVPALVMGNSVVFKPATNGSLVGLYLGQLALKANLPKGIFNVVTGKGSNIGDYLINNKNIDLISFTGSVNVGNSIKKSGKELVLELGGKDPGIILDEYNLDKIAQEIISGGFSYSGQRCTAIKRVITTDKIANKLVPLLKSKILKLTINNKKNGYISPLIDLKSAEYVQELIDDALLKKAKLIIGNKRKDNLIYPTLIDNVTSNMKLAWEEPFGPVLPIIRLNKIEDMIKIVNQSNFGLQASIFTKDINLALKIARKLEVGTVNINGKTQRGPDSFPFLGIKDSGQGVQGIRHSLLSSVRLKGNIININ